MTTALIPADATEIEVVAVHNVLGLRVGQRAVLPVTTPELSACLAYGFVRLVIDGEEVVPDASTAVTRRGGCGCGG